MKIGILGAGAAGLSAAYFLRNSGHEIIVHESSHHVGGLAQSFRWHDFDCDIGPHRLYCDDAVVLGELKQLTPLRRIRRRSSIYVRGLRLRDPLSVSDLLLKLPSRLAWKVVRSYLARPQLPEASFAALARNRFGDGLFELFFKPYSEKLFGIEADQIAASWGRRKLRLGGLTRPWRRPSRHYFRSFHYPTNGGYGAICSGLYRTVQPWVRLRSRLVSIRPDDNASVTCSFDDEGTVSTERFDKVVSSLPITLCASSMGLQSVLQFRPMRLVYLLIDRPRISHDQWFYLADRDNIINRVAEFKNFCSDRTPAGRTVICCEVTDLQSFSFARVSAGLAHACGIRESEILDTKVVDLERAYPIYDRAYEEELRRVEQFFAGHPQIVHVGRDAQFVHQDVDEIFSQARIAVTAMLHRR